MELARKLKSIKTFGICEVAGRILVDSSVALALLRWKHWEGCSAGLRAVEEGVSGGCRGRAEGGNQAAWLLAAAWWWSDPLNCSP